MSKFLNQRFRTLSAYVPGEQPQDQVYVKLNTNESPYPPAPGVLSVLCQEADFLNLYPDPENRKLKPLLAARFNLKPENVFIANGSDEILSFAFMSLFDDGVVFPDISYGFYSVYASFYGVANEQLPLNSELCVDPSAYCNCGCSVVLANPNAPTGIALPLTQIEQIVCTNREHVVLIDEAYVDFGITSAAGLVDKYDNLLVVQTFSKSRSLAGARLGFALGSAELIADLEQIKYSTNPYNVNRLTQAVGYAALQDEDYYRTCVEAVCDCRDYTTNRLHKLGMEVLPSQTNFVFARCPGYNGGELYHELKNRGILVRWFEQPRIKDWLRITIGTRAQIDLLCSALAEILGGK